MIRMNFCLIGRGNISIIRRVETKCLLEKLKTLKCILIGVVSEEICEVYSRKNKIVITIPYSNQVSKLLH